MMWPRLNSTDLNISEHPIMSAESSVCGSCYRRLVFQAWIMLTLPACPQQWTQNVWTSTERISVVTAPPSNQNAAPEQSVILWTDTKSRGISESSFCPDKQVGLHELWSHTCSGKNKIKSSTGVGKAQVTADQKASSSCRARRTP